VKASDSRRAGEPRSASLTDNLNEQTACHRHRRTTAESRSRWSGDPAERVWDWV